jgi:hypothetical protein
MASVSELVRHRRSRIIGILSGVRGSVAIRGSVTIVMIVGWPRIRQVGGNLASNPRHTRAMICFGSWEVEGLLGAGISARYENKDDV